MLYEGPGGYDKGVGDSAFPQDASRDWANVVLAGERMHVSEGPCGSGALGFVSAGRFAKGVGGFTGSYDANRNLVYRVVEGKGQILSYDRESRLTGVSWSSGSASFTYDGDGNRVVGTVGGVTTVYIGNHYEVSGGTVRKYYYHWGKRVAMRDGGTLFWLLTDHLGSTAILAAGGTGAKDSELRYMPWGEKRSGYSITRTTYRYTGQRHELSTARIFTHPCAKEFTHPRHAGLIDLTRARSP